MLVKTFMQLTVVEQTYANGMMVDTDDEDEVSKNASSFKNETSTTYGIFNNGW